MHHRFITTCASWSVTLLAAACLLAGCSSAADKLERDMEDAADTAEPEVTLPTQCDQDDECDDGVPCTRDSCSAEGKCVFAPSAGDACDDGNACTSGDACNADGTCGGADAVTCQDDNPCTSDTCDPKQGCTFTPADGPTECDGTLCTAGDACQDGQCTAGKVVECPDTNEDDCSFLTCKPATGACDVAQSQPAGHACADGNPCTDNDQCDAGGVCQPGTPHGCESQHPCKSAWCNEQAKEGTNPCVMEMLPEGTPCSDGSQCTDNDKCALGQDGLDIQCSGMPVDCDDGNPCTLDACAEESGCLYQNKGNGSPCGETGACGGIPSCQDGICVSKPGTSCDDGIPCTADACSPEGKCVSTPNDAACQDDSPCTDDFCDSTSGCVHSPNAAACSDGNPCTLDDQCAGGQCQPGPQVNCDDGNPCTIDACAADGSCTHTSPVESCGNQVDDDCDGQVDEGCGGTCTPYDVQPCYDGPAGTAGVGTCKSGFRQCTASGNSWSPCYDQVMPIAADVCNNQLDDDCDGSQTDQDCSNQPGGVVWVDFDHGSDNTGNGSFINPWQTITHALNTGAKQVMAKADADGTIYTEQLNLSSSNHNLVLTGWGPTRPVINARVSIVHCYDCTMQNFELRYPKPAADPQNDPQAVIDAVHNYRGTFRDILFSAPDGLPSGKRLATCHHGYDNLYIDVLVDNVTLLPAADGNGSFVLLDWQDHGSGSQFVRTKLGTHITAGGTFQSLDFTFISVGGYCGNWPKGVSAARNCLATDLDLDAMAAGSTTFGGIRFWCYFPTDVAGGVMLANNTIANITASQVQAISLDMAFDFAVTVTSNVIGPFNTTSATGVQANHPATVIYSDLYQLQQQVSGQAVLSIGCKNEDPKFVVGGDYHLKPGSPCLNTGDPTLPDPDGSAGDMGAYGGPYAK